MAYGENIMESLDEKTLNKKRLILFIAIAYGITYLMMIPMYIGKQHGYDLTQIVDAQMCSPAAGVALGFLLFYKGEKRVPKFFMTVVVINYVIQLVLGLLSVVAGRERRKFAGLSRNNGRMGILLVLLYVALYLPRVFLPVIIEGLANNNLSEFFSEYALLFKQPLFYISLVSLPLNYPLTIVAFFGEEYGWRYFLQPVMQKKFGMKAGVILLGVVWGLWHLPVDTMFYTKDSIPQMIVGQIITCVSIGIFFGFAYLKTNNIWVCVAMHFLNNNLIPILSGALSADVLQDQSVTWMQLLEILVIDLVVFCLFIFAKEYKEKKNKTEEAVNA